MVELVEEVKKTKKIPFGGRTVNFKGATETMEEVFGKTPIAPNIMTKELWVYIKANDRVIIPDVTPLRKIQNYLGENEFAEDLKEKVLVGLCKNAGVSAGALKKMSKIFKSQTSNPGDYAIAITDLVDEILTALEAKEAEE